MIEQFRSYIGQVLNSADNFKQSRYLSKNNNNILRLSTIQAAFPEALFIIPFRDPIQQSMSLLEQHKRFCSIHQNSKFAYQYMRWLGHYEFGLTHRPFEFDDGEKAVRLTDKPDNIDYWISLWNRTYRYLLEIAPSNCVFSCYEEFCEDPKSNLARLFGMAQTPSKTEVSSLELRLPRERQMPQVDKVLRGEGQIIYDEMRRRER